MQFSLFYIGGFIVIMFGLVMYNVIPVPEGDTELSVFSAGYWYNYGHSLFCEWRCRHQHDELKLADLNVDDIPLPSIIATQSKKHSVTE